MPNANSVKPIFLPLLDNGNGQVMSAFMMDYVAAIGQREVFLIRASDSHANRGMNKVANAFLKSPCDLWLNIDADIRFSKQHVDRIIDHGLPLVYGLYPKKQEDCLACVCTFDKIPLPDERGLVEVRRAGRGFMLCHRKVLEAMKEDNGGPALRYHNHGEIEWDFFPSGTVRGEMSCYGDENNEDGTPRREWLSEDWMFCEIARKLGYPTLVDTAIALGHVGQKEYIFHGDQLTPIDASGITSWKDIDGWFDFENLYRRIAAQIPDGGTFVEVGCWLGRSVGAFAQFVKEAGKTVSIHVVDTFQAPPASDRQAAILRTNGGNVQKVFEANMKALGLTDIVTVHPMDSLDAAFTFPAGADAIFIDADHSEEAVYKDICAWSPKMKKGGILAGHDIDYPSVQQAVYRFFGTDHEVMDRTWFVRW